MPEVVGVVVGVALLVVLFKPVFGDFDGFWQCLKFWLTPDIVSMFRGEYSEDWISEMKLFLWLAGSIGLGFAARALVLAILS